MLFEQEAICFEQQDGVTTKRAVEMFGIEAVKFILEKEDDATGFQLYRMGAYKRLYVTLHGFLIAATYRNLELVDPRLTEARSRRRRNNAHSGHGEKDSSARNVAHIADYAQRKKRKERFGECEPSAQRNAGV